MESKAFLEKFTEQFIDCDDLTIELDSNFRDIDSFDSLTGMAIIMMIEDEYEKKIEDQEFKSCKTVQELIDLVQSK
jgi:acyl carrier protein